MMCIQGSTKMQMCRMSLKYFSLMCIITLSFLKVVYITLPLNTKSSTSIPIILTHFAVPVFYFFLMVTCLEIPASYYFLSNFILLVEEFYTY